MGLDFLVEWVIAGWRKLSRTDYAVVLLILVVIGATNFLIGVGVGLVAMIVLFVLNYSRINVVHHALSGAELRSNVERCAYHQRALTEKLGQHIYILELQGFLFLGRPMRCWNGYGRAWPTRKRPGALPHPGPAPRDRFGLVGGDQLCQVHTDR